MELFLKVRLSQLITILGEAKIDHLKLTSNAEIARVAPATVTHAKITECARKLD